MGELSRRGFIGGLVASVASGTALVKLASPSQQAMLKQGDPVLMPPDPDVEGMPMYGRGRMYVAILGIDGARTYEAVGWMRDLTITSAIDDLVTYEFGMDVAKIRMYQPIEKKLDFRAIIDQQRGTPW